MKLRKIVVDGKIIYTLKLDYNGKKTKDVHYKFVGLREPKEFK